MKNKRIFICLIILITSIVISCSWQIPENVKVKTKADYNFGLGNVKTDLTSQLDIPKMIKDQGIELPLGMTIQDYFPGKADSDTQRYLVKIPFVQIPLDIEQYLKQLDMITKMDPIEIEEVKFKVPELSLPEISVDVPIDDVIKYINIGLKGAGFVNTTATPLYPTAVLDAAGLSIGTVTYGPNSHLVIEGQDIQKTVQDFGGTLPPLSEGAEYRFSKTIPDGRKVTIDFATGDTQTVIVKDNKAIFDISNKTFNVADVKITFDKDPYIELVDENASTASVLNSNSSRGIPGLEGLDLNLEQMPIPDNVKDIIKNPPTKEEITTNPDILNKIEIEGITPGTTPDQIKEQIASKKPVLVVEGYLANIQENSSLKNITGLTLKDATKTDKPLLPVPANMPGQKVNNMLPPESGVIRAKIGEGNLSIKLDGIKTKYDITVETKPIEVEGGKTEYGLKLPQIQITNDNPTINLANTAVEPGGFLITGKANIYLDNAEITFDPLPKVIVKPTLNKIASATADINAFGDNINNMLKFEDSFPLPPELSQFVHSINLNQSGVSITYTNTLPEGNDIKFNAVSNFLNIHKIGVEAVTIKSGVTNETQNLYTSGEIVIQGKKDPAVDFSVEVILPTEEGDPANYVTAKNVESNKEYSIKFKLTPKIDWKSITINTAELPIPIEPINTNLNLYSQLHEIATSIGQPDIFDRLSLTSLPMYLFCTIPNIDALKSMAINAKANLYFGKENLDTHKIEPVGTAGGYILGDKNNFETVKVVNKLPTLTVEELPIPGSTNKTQIVTTDLEKLPESDVSLKLDEKKVPGIISDIMKTDGSLCLDYDVQITDKTDPNKKQITINSEDLKGIKDTVITLEAYIDLGLAFDLAGIEVGGKPSDVGMAIDVIKLAKLEETLKEDLLQGQIAEIKKQGIDKVMKAIKEISVSYHVNALPLSLDTNKDLAITIGLNDDIEKSVGLQKGTIGIVNADIDKVLAKEKLLVNKIEVLVPAGTFSIKRAKNVELGLDVKLATDGTIEVMKDGKLTFGGAK